MLDIDLLRFFYSVYQINYFLNKFPECFCYREVDEWGRNVIMWEIPVEINEYDITSIPILNEYDTFLFSCSTGVSPIGKFRDSNLREVVEYLTGKRF
jgi:hypothetical protein